MIILEQSMVTRNNRAIALYLDFQSPGTLTHPSLAGDCLVF